MQDLIHVTVKLWGPAADLAGTDLLEYALAPSSATLSTLTELLCAKYTRLSRSAGFLRYAVNGEYVQGDQALREGDEIGVIPPVSGGQDEFVQLTKVEICVADLVERVADTSCGGLVTFEGVVRAEGPPDRPLEALDYTAYEEMALRLMQAIRSDARKQFDIHEAAIVHRLGRMAIGECSIAIVVSAPHRAAAFDACRWIIDAVKKDVPIWKKEIWAGGDSTWVDPLPSSSS